MLQTLFKSTASRSSKSILLDESMLQKSRQFVNVLGYTILALMFVDYIYILIPPHFFDPNWELEIMGKIIETVFVTLLGFMLVFFRSPENSVKYSEIRILSGLSWLALIFSIICFLFTPLIISNALRISHNNQVKTNILINEQQQQIEQINLKLDQLTDQEIQTIWDKNNNSTSLIDKQIPPIEQKQQLIKKINQQKQTNQTQLQKNLKNNQMSLFKMTFKWILGSIIAGISFMSLWKYNQWTREIWSKTRTRL